MRPSDDAGCHGRSPEEKLCDELTTKFVVDVNPDDIVKGVFGRRETELPRPSGVEIAWPSGDDTRDERIALAPDARGDLVSGHALERGDLFADGCRQTRHGEVSARADRGRVHGPGMNEETDGRTRRGVPVPHLFRHRQDRFLAGKRLAQDAGEKS